MKHKFRSIVHISLFFGCLVLFLPSIGSSVEKDTTEVAATPVEIETIIKKLENDTEREELIKTLRLILDAQQSAKAENKVKSAASNIILDISGQVARARASIIMLTGTIYEIPAILDWIKGQLKDSETRGIWGDVAFNLVVTLGLGYLVFYILRFGFNRTLLAVTQKGVKSFPVRLFRALSALFISFLPIVGFTVTAYLALSFINPRENTRLVALVWVNAFIISRVIVAVLYFILAPQSPSLRFTTLTDEDSNYLLIWGKRLSTTTIYGYFTLQAALLLGLPSNAYEFLFRLLGLLITALVIILILQNRVPVAQFLARPLFPVKSEDPSDTTPDGKQESVQLPQQTLRAKLAKAWHLFAFFYAILLYGVWALHIPGGFLFLLRATLLTLLVFLILRAVLRMLNAIFVEGFRINDDLKTRFPGLETRANRYISTLFAIFKLVVSFFTTMVILQIWGIKTFSWLSSQSGRVLSGTIASVLGIILVTFIIWEIANSLIESSLNKRQKNGTDLDVSPRTRTLLTVARKALAIVLTIVSTLMVLSEIGVNIGPLLAGAGVLGLAIGFGSQKLVQDVITGIFILLEDQIAVGDYIDLGGITGTVEAVSIRTVRLRDPSGTVHTIPFSSISTVSNLTKDFSFAVINIGIAYRENVDEVMIVLKEIGADLQADSKYGLQILEPLEILGVDAFADSAVMIKARIKTVPSEQWWVGREFNRRMKNKFDELDIEIPFPHQTIYFGIDKRGKAAPARLSIQPD